MNGSAAEGPSGGGSAGSEGDEPDQAPYVHDQGSAGIGAGLVDAAYAAATRWWDVTDHAA